MLLKKITDFIKSHAKLLIIIFAVVLVAIFAFVIITGKKVTPEKLMNINFEQDNMPSKQELIVSMDTSLGKFDTDIFIEKDKDTSYIYSLCPSGKENEMYVTIMDTKLGVYYKENDNWMLEYKTKNISEDDSRTNFVESNNEINLSEIDINSFKNLELTEEDDYYVVTGKTTYITAIAMIDNLRQHLMRSELYSEASRSLISKGTQLEVDITFYCNLNSGLIEKMIVKSNEDDLKDKGIETVKNFTYELNNLSYDAIDIVVPREIAKSSITVTD